MRPEDRIINRVRQYGQLRVRNKQAVDNSVEKLREAVCEAHDKLGLSEKHLAEMAGVSRMTIRNYLNKRDWNPSRGKKNS